jgi:hypothetical protein
MTPLLHGEKRTVLVHLNVEVPAEDQRNAVEIASALMEALEVGSDDETVYYLRPVMVMAEEL